MFSSLYVAAMRHLRPSEPGWAAKGWLGEVHLHNGIVTRPWISSLSAFWPGLQATIGEPPPQQGQCSLIQGSFVLTRHDTVLLM